MTPLEQMCVRIADLGACQEAQDWMEELPSDWTPQQAWDVCDCSDWMLWLLGRSKQPDTGKMVAVACRIARTVLHTIPPDEERPRLAIEAAEAWVRNPSEETARQAYAAANAAARAAADAARAAADAAAAKIIREFFPNPPELG